VAPAFSSARDVLLAAIADRVTPAAVLEVGTSRRPLWREAFGRLTYEGPSPETREDTVFDLASLTKVLATAPLVIRHIERGSLALDDLVSDRIAGWRGGDREHVTVRDLLSHCSGLPAHLHLYRHLSGRPDFADAISAAALEYPPRSAAVYSDLGFMLLGFILEDLAPLDTQFDALRVQMGNIQDLQFHPSSAWRTRTAPTQEKNFRGGLLVGEVDDDNAWALGGAAGHAGLFGTASAVGECARHVLQILEGRTGAFRGDTLRTFITRRADVPGSSRALGWDTMLPTSSCGSLMSPRAFGHTGFTGTSLWVDPDRNVYVVLLTNRVHPRAEGDAITRVRRAVHDEVIQELDRPATS
jgi:CubicO group peptidase (beta-lactamase class C family)